MSTVAASGSIRRRLTLQLAAIAVLLSVAFFLIVRGVAEQAAGQTQDQILAASATSIADALRSEKGQVQLELPYSALSMLGSVSEDRVFYRVAIAGQTLTGYDDLPLPALPETTGEPVFATFDYRGEPVRSVTLGRNVSIGERPVEVVVSVAQTRLFLGAIRARISTLAAAVGLAFFAVAVSLSLWAAHSALRPLERLALSVTRRGPKDLRPLRAETPAELVPLVAALNNFMERLRASLARSEDFIAEAAHRVRTPLATLRAQAEIAYRRVERPENRAALKEMILAIDESSRSAGQLLDHAMVTFRTDHLETEQLDLGELARDTCNRLEPTAELKDIGLELELPDAPALFRGDPILLENALRNIVDNAIKYSPPDSLVRIALQARGGDYVIRVCDNGRGFGAGDLRRMTRRFSRGTNVEDIVGSGLGLTIADEVARAHGGRLELARNKGGKGACVSLVLPRP